MRKRSKYRPKGVIFDTMNHVLSGMKIVGAIKNHDALDKVRRGVATRVDIDTLIAAFNITEALALKASLGGEWKDEIRAAQDALLELGRRGAETGKFILRGPDLTTFNTAMDIHDAQLDACTVAELEKAIDYVAAVVAAKQARVIIKK